MTEKSVPQVTRERVHAPGTFPCSTLSVLSFSSSFSSTDLLSSFSEILSTEKFFSLLTRARAHERGFSGFFLIDIESLSVPFSLHEGDLILRIERDDRIFQYIMRPLA
jgi:hypothetical protein